MNTHKVYSFDLNQTVFSSGGETQVPGGRRGSRHLPQRGFGLLREQRQPKMVSDKLHKQERPSARIVPQRAAHQTAQAPRHFDQIGSW